MFTVAKKKGRADVPADEDRVPDEAEAVDILLRGVSPQLADALNRHAKQTRRSRNQAIIILLEEAMQRAGLWSPP